MKKTYKNISDFLLSELCLDNRVEDGIFDIFNNDHMEVLREKLVEMGIPKSEVVDDTVRMSKWQTSKRLENGDRDIAWLYSYRARFRRKANRVLPDEDIEALRQKVSKWKQPKRPANKPSDEPPCTFVINWADLQLGKSAGGGVEATVERVLESLEKTVYLSTDPLCHYIPRLSN